MLVHSSMLSHMYVPQSYSHTTFTHTCTNTSDAHTAEGSARTSRRPTQGLATRLSEPYDAVHAIQCHAYPVTVDPSQYSDRDI